MDISLLEQEFDNLWESLFPFIDLDAEQSIIPDRKFKFDYVHHRSKVAIEINGGIWMKGFSKHSSGVGLTRDYEKNNLAIASGYVVFWLSGDMIDEPWLTTIANTIEARLSC